MSVAQLLAENLATVRGRIADGAHRSGRSPTEITLVAVTKYVGTDMAQQLVTAGCHNLGESRPQELWAKAQALTDSSNESTSTQQTTGEETVRWHLIGHLQRNKIARTAPLVSLIHSGDNLRLLQALHEHAVAANRRLPVLLEVNISGDATKHGFLPAEIEPALPALSTLSSLEIRGLMGMASREGDLTQACREFAALRKLRDCLQQAAGAQLNLHELSMGMSGDYEAAIAEGATIVRIGSALFEGIIS